MERTDIKDGMLLRHTHIPRGEGDDGLRRANVKDGVVHIRKLDGTLVNRLYAGQNAQWYEPAEQPVAPRKVKPGDWIKSLSSAERKECPVASGVFAYFPDAIYALARHSKRSNDKHNPGEPLHWSREKSSDHNDCVARHSVAVAADPEARDDGQPEVICRLWRAAAEAQLWIEREFAAGRKI